MTKADLFAKTETCNLISEFIETSYGHSTIYTVNFESISKRMESKLAGMPTEYIDQVIDALYALDDEQTLEVEQ